jgi:hypothetical protein
MRRVLPDLSYKERTRDIIDQSFDEWQLTRKEEREGIHRFINRVVSMGEEFNREVDYVQDMFFPDMMDLSEEWVIYRTSTNAPSSDVYITEVPVSGALTLAKTPDHLIAGEIDILVHKNTLSGIVSPECMVATEMSSIYLIDSGRIYTIDLVESGVVSSGQVSITGEISVEATFDRNHRYYLIEEEFQADSLSVATPSGDVVPYDILTEDTLSGIWSPDFDVDNDGVIWEREKSILDSICGSTMKDSDPEEWSAIAWADVDKDGVITEQDYASVNSAIPSVRPGVTGVIRLPAEYVGVYHIKYVPSSQRIVDIYRAGKGFINRHSKTKLEGFHKITYDEDTDIYYGIEKEKKTLRAFTYELDLDNIASDILLHIDVWNKDCELIDVDMHKGYLFILVSDGAMYKVIYDDVRKEYVESISLTATFELPSGFKPQGMSITEDGYAVCYEGDRIEVFSLSRDRYIDIDGVAYFNRKHEYENSNGEDYTLIPQLVFNSFDSFAYSLGINRPWGKDNMEMRKTIFDFFKHQQGHNAIEMSYGITRELGFVNETTVGSGEAYYLPNKLSPSGTITVNDEVMNVIQVEEDSFALTGEIGTIEMEAGLIVVPSADIVKKLDYLDIEGFYYDAEGYLVELFHHLEINKGRTEPVIKVKSLADKAHLEETGLMTSGEAEPAMVLKIKESEDESPFIYRNAIPNKSNIDMWRLGEDPVAPTSFSPDMSGVVTSGSDSEVEV